MRVAITGGIAEGKSTVCGLLRDLGYSVVSADDIVRELHEDPAVIAVIGDEVGERFVVADRLDKAALRNALGDSDVRKALNRILHPRVMRHILERTDIDGVTFAEVPLLIETATQGLFDEVWVVTSGVREQRRRLVERLGNEAEADALLSTQLPTAAKIPFADRVVRTNERPETVKLTLAEYVRRLVEE